MTHANEALDWFARRRSARDAAADEAFSAWLDAAPQNADAYAEVERLWDVTSEVADHPEIQAWTASLDRSAGRRSTTRRAIAASFAAAVIGVGGVGVYSMATPKRLVDQSFRTAVGQQATVTLPDGSVVTLNTDTVVRTRGDKARRLVYLDKGQAFFRVAKDRRHPFVVTAAGRTVTALGTAFDVHVDRGGLKVVLVEGKVRVEPAAAQAARPGPAPRNAAVATDMAPGSQLVAPSDADWRVTSTDVARETSWLNGQIVISDEPLLEAVEELNRYSTRKIIVDDPALATTRVSGIFRPGDLEGFARALKTSGLAQVDRQTDTEFRIVALK